MYVCAVCVSVCVSVVHTKNYYGLVLVATATQIWYYSVSSSYLSPAVYVILVGIS